MDLLKDSKKDVIKGSDENKMGCLVTVVIPTYKRTVHYLARAVQSVLNQTYKNIEIIVIDDSPSTYQYRNEIQTYMDSLESEKVHYYQNETNIGGALARNRGILLARGTFVSFLDDDDEYCPHKIEKQVKFMIQENCDLSFTDMIMYSYDGKIVDYRTYEGVPLGDRKKLLHYHLMNHMTGTPTFMFKTAMLRKINGFDDVKMGQEFHLMLKAIEQGLKIGYLKECDVKIYKHSDGGISQGKNKIDGENKLYEFKKRYYSELSLREREFIDFRHWAVLSVAYGRNRMYIKMCLSVLKSFLCSPKVFFRQTYRFIGNIIEMNRVKV